MLPSPLPTNRTFSPDPPVPSTVTVKLGIFCWLNAEIAPAAGKNDPPDGPPAKPTSVEGVR
jgi:hypothetical protein